jgi:pilus assembly protein Flp/PilA
MLLWGTTVSKRGNHMNLLIVRTWLQVRFASTERGASMVEYILLVALIALAVIAAVSFLGGTMTGKFNTEGSQISSAGQ